MDMAAVVAKFGNNAGDAFSSSEEVVAFSNLIQKQMTIAGASTAEAANAMMQLSQALGSGALRGDELNSIFEQAPNLIQSIADYLQVPIGEIRALATEGKLSAQTVKDAIFAASDSINAQFESIPMTWGQVWTTMKNAALMKFQPVLQKVSELANNQDFQMFAASAIDALTSVASFLLNIMEIAGSIASFFYENWSIISPVVWAIVAALGAYVAILTVTKIINWAHALSESVKAAAVSMSMGATFGATAAQHGFNAALLACPLTWIILLIIAVVVVLMVLCNWIAKATGAANSGIGIIVGALAVAAAFIGNLFIALINFGIDIFTVFWNYIASFVNFFANVFTDPVGAIARLFFDLVDCILSLLQSLASAIDTIFGSNLAGAVQGWRDSLGGWVDETFGEGTEIMAKVNSEDLHLDRFDYGEAWDAGVELGDSIGSGVGESLEDFGVDTSNVFDGGGYEGYEYEGYDAGQVPSNIEETAENTGSMADSMELASEDLKYLRDVAESEAVNRFTTAEIKVEMVNNNNVSSDMDLDGIVEYLVIGVNEAMEKAAEGVHT